jgi:hypothetical protein
MTHRLRHLTARLWITLVIGGASTLGAMMLLQPVIGLEAAPAAAAVLMSGSFVAVGWAAARLGLWRVRRLLSAAEAAERDGLRVAAAALFDRAGAVFDSFLIPPALRRRRLPALHARMARFHLSDPGGHGAREAFIRRYLMRAPGDAEVAEGWVAALERWGGPAEEEVELAACLAAAHPRHERIQKTLARLYLAQEVTDYQALQCYRRVCAGEDPPDPGFCRAVARLVHVSGCSDEWARRLVLRFCGPGPGGGGAEPVVTPLPAAAAPSRMWEAAPADAVTAEEEDAGAFRMSVFPGEPEEEEETAPRTRPRGAAMAAIREGAGRLADGLLRFTADVLRRAFRIAARVGAAPWSRPAGLCGLGAVLLAGGLWFWWDDIRLLREEAEAPAAAVSEPAPAPLVMDRFTLQVAAYLKAEHAYKFVDQLKRQGFEAYWTETVSGGKTWYQVRIASFPDRQSARELGSRLKQKGVIEDFYVTLYSR